MPESSRHGGWRTGCDRRSRRADAQPQEHRRHASRRQADHRHRGQRIGEVVAGLRHDLRRRAAALCRVALRVRAAVPRADGEAGRRSHRRHRAGHRHPPEEQHPQSALDRRHDDRDPRLHAAAVRPRRTDVLPELRPRSGARDGRSRRQPAGELGAGTRLLLGFDLPLVEAAPLCRRRRRSTRKRSETERRRQTDTSRDERGRAIALAGGRRRAVGVDDRLAAAQRASAGCWSMAAPSSLDDVDAEDAGRQVGAAGRRRSRSARRRG